jgi:hypothetical protein
MHASNSRLARRMIRPALLSGLLLVIASAISCSAAKPETSPIAGIDDAAHLALSANARERQEGMQWLLRNGDRTSVAVLIQLLRWLPDEEGFVAARLERLTGAHVGPRWFDWMIWQQGHPEFVPYPGYTGFLADLLAGIDPRFRRFLRADVPHEICPEEIVWGGVAVDGIPALDNPTMIAASEASYLNPDDRVFGVEIGSDARAYPLS